MLKDEVVLPEATPVADRRNMAYSGTLVTTGTGAGVAIATGAGTELGEIHRLVGAAESLATPLTRKLAEFSRLLTVGILALAGVTFAVGVARGQGAAETFTAAVALAVGAIPEGLPAAVTITLAIGVARMARRRAVIRRLPAVETLGSTTVICSDKTGTLTENQMTVRTLWTPSDSYEVTGPGASPEGSVRDGRDRDLEGVLDDEALRWSRGRRHGLQRRRPRPRRGRVAGRRRPHRGGHARGRRQGRRSTPPRWRGTCPGSRPCRSTPSASTWPPCTAGSTATARSCSSRGRSNASSTSAAPRWTRAAAPVPSNATAVLAAAARPRLGRGCGSWPPR